MALQLLCAREAETEAFEPEAYWLVEAAAMAERGGGFTARLARLDGEAIDRGRLVGGAEAAQAAERIGVGVFHVDSLKQGEVRRNLVPRFTSSTLKQEASRPSACAGPCGSPRRSTRVSSSAAGLITYMRTYSAAMSNRAAGAARRIVRERFGADYLPAKPRVFRSSARNGREAHEAIRPTDFSRAPESLAGRIGEDEAGLYALIWQPAVAIQMVAARLDRVRVEIESESGAVALVATGSRIVFDGFLRVWREGGEEDGAEDGGALETLAFAVTLNRATWSWVRVDYATRDGTATAGVDYTATSGTLAFAPGEPEKAVNVAILDDAIDEGKEHFFLTLSNPQGAFLRNRHCEAKGVIMNDDPLQKM